MQFSQTKATYLPTLNPINALVHETLNAEYELTFTLPGTVPIEKHHLVSADTPNGRQEFRVASVDYSAERTDVFARHIFFDLSGNFSLGFSSKDVTCQTAVNLFIDSLVEPLAPFTLMAKDVTSRGSYNPEEANALEVLTHGKRSICGIFETDLYRNNRTIELRGRLGTDTNVLIHPRKNIVDLSRSYSSDDICTKIILRGGDEENPLSATITSPLVDKYPVTYIRRYQNETEQITTVEQLVAWGKLFFDTDRIDVPTLSFEFDVINSLNLMLGDSCLVRVPQLGVDVRERVNGYDYDPMSKRTVKLYFGDRNYGMSSIVGDIAQGVVEPYVKDVDDKLQEQIDNANSAIDKEYQDRVDAMNDAIAKAEADVAKSKEELQEEISQAVTDWNTDFEEAKQNIDTSIGNVSKELGEYIESTDEIIAKHDDLIVDANTAIGNLNSDIDSAKNNISDLVQADSVINTAIGNLNTDVGNAKNDISDLFESTEANQGAIVTVSNNLGTLSTKVSNVETTANTANATASEVKQTASGLTSTVSSLQGTVNNATGDITKLKSDVTTVTQTASGLSSKVTSLESDNVTNKQNIASVTQTASGLTTQVSAVETTANSALAKATTVEQTANGLKSSVTSLETTVENIEVGGRNLLTIENVGAYSGGNIRPFNNNVSFENYVFTVNGNPNDLVGGKTEDLVSTTQLTISGTTDLGRITLYYKFNNTVQKNINVPVTNSKFIQTLEVPVDATLVSIGVGQYPYVTEYYIKGLKFEKGNKSTDWTPAPEDVDSSISSVNNTATTALSKATTVEQTANGLTSTVSSLQGTVNNATGDITKLKSDVTTVTQTASGLSSKVTSLESDNVTNKQNIASVTQTASGLTTQVGNVETTANSALAKATTVEQTASGLTSKVTSLETSDGKQNSAISSLEQTASGITSTVSKHTNQLAGTEASALKTLADTANTNAGKAQTSANTANNLLTDIASDSKFTASEKQQVKTEWDIIVSEQTSIKTEAIKFGVSTTDYTNKYNTLNTYITPLLSSLTTTSDIVGTTFRTNFKNYYDARQTVLNGISSKAKSLADTAQSTADTAQTTANTAKSTADSASKSATTANNLHADIASDSKLTASEKQQAKKEWDIVVGEKTGITAEGSRYGISTTDYTNKYNTLNTYITPLLSSLTTTSDIVGTTYRANWKNYYDARQLLLNAISAKAKSLADSAQNTANTAYSEIQQTADKISMIVSDGSTASAVQLTPNALTAIAKDINLKGNVQFNSLIEGDGTNTQILGGKIKTNSISANKLIISGNELISLVEGEDFGSFKYSQTNLVSSWASVTGNEDTKEACYFPRMDIRNLGIAGKKIQIKLDFAFWTSNAFNINWRFEFHWNDLNGNWQGYGSTPTFSRKDGWSARSLVISEVSIPLDATGCYIKIITTNSASEPDTVHFRKLTCHVMNAGELIVDGAIRANHITSSTAEIASITSKIMSTDVLNASWANIGNALINKLTADDVLVNQLTAKSAFITKVQSIDLSATRITGGVLKSTNGSLEWNLANSYLKFSKASNAMEYVSSSSSAGISFGDMYSSVMGRNVPTVTLYGNQSTNASSNIGLDILSGEQQINIRADRISFYDHPSSTNGWHLGTVGNEQWSQQLLPWSAGYNEIGASTKGFYSVNCLNIRRNNELTYSTANIKNNINLIEDKVVREVFENTKIKEYYYNDEDSMTPGVLPLGYRRDQIKVGMIIEDIVPEANSEYLLMENNNYLKSDNVLFLNWRMTQLLHRDLNEAYDMIIDLQKQVDELKNK